MNLDELTAFNRETSRLIGRLETRQNRLAAELDAIALCMGMTPSRRGIASWSGKAGEYAKTAACATA